MRRPRWFALSPALLWHVWSCAARIPVAPAGTVPVVLPEGTPR